MNPYCFVITSFGKKDNIKDLDLKSGKKIRKIDFDSIYKDLIEPAIRKAKLEPLIEYEEKSRGLIHKTMYEKIVLCEFCVVDMTNLNANVFYELGMRYAVKPFTTIPIIASSHFPLPFDVCPNRTITYQVDKNFKLSDKDNDINKLANELLKAKKDRSTDSPLYDLVNGIEFQNAVAHEKTDVFRDEVKYNETIKEKLRIARTQCGDLADKDKQRIYKTEAINKIVKSFKSLENIETGVLIDMMISYRQVDAFREMQEFIEKLPSYVMKTVMVREQYAFILNRNGGKANPVDTAMIDKAEHILEELQNENKASSETYGIWGRIYKDKFDRAYKENKPGEAKVQLKQAMEYYKRGFEFDMRDAYPGVNYVTCLELLGEKEKAMRLVPVVEYAVKSKMNRKKPDYWDYATLLELAVIENRFDLTDELIDLAKSRVVEEFMIPTTTGNLKKIINYRKERGEKTITIEEIVAKLN